MGTDMSGPDQEPPSEAPRKLPPELDPRGPRRAGADDPQAPKPPRPRMTRRRRIITWTAGIVAAIVLVSSVTSWAFLHHLLDSINKINPFCTSCDRPSGGVKGDLNILLVGSDSRAGLTDAQKQSLH